MFRKILVPSDLREASLVAIKTAVELARANGAQLFLLNVRPEFMSKAEMEMLRISAQKFIKEERDIAVNAKAVLAEMLERSGGGNIGHQILLREGNARDEILASAKELDCDLIIVTTQGRSRLSEHLHGSDSEQLVRETRIPILVIPVLEK